MKTLAALLAVACLAVSSTAQAQMTGTGEGREHPDEVRSQTQDDSPATAPVAPAKPAPPPKPVSDAEIVGVVKAVDAQANRVTIAYEPVAARNWPAGEMPFGAYKSSLLKDVTVGEKVRFKLDGQQITDIAPY